MSIDPHDQPYDTGIGRLPPGPMAPNVVGGPLSGGRVANYRAPGVGDPDNLPADHFVQVRPIDPDNAPTDNPDTPGPYAPVAQEE